MYRPAGHKTAYRGRHRAVCIGPRGQAVLTPLLARAGEGYMLNPARERDEWLARLRAARKTKVQPSQVSRKKVQAAKLPGERYTTDSYGQAVAMGVRKANRARALPPDFVGPPLPPVPHWHPNQIRHAFATAVRKRVGLEAAGAALGHAKMSVTEVYAERDHDLAARAAAETG